MRTWIFIHDSSKHSLYIPGSLLIANVRFSKSNNALYMNLREHAPLKLAASAAPLSAFLQLQFRDLTSLALLFDCLR